MKNKIWIGIIATITILFVVWFILVRPGDKEAKDNSSGTLEGVPGQADLYTDEIAHSDGKLQLSIMPLEKSCVELGKPFKIQFELKNSSNNSIKIARDFEVAISKNSSQGTMLPVFLTEDRQIVISALDVMNLGYEEPSAEVGYDDLSMGQVISGEVEVLFPEWIVTDPNSTDGKILKPASGNYFMRIVYRSIMANETAWQGMISSNLIEVCLDG